MKKSINFKDDFEILYLRHDYIKKATLDPSYIEKHERIVNTTAQIMFDRLTNFEKVGFHLEDVISVTNMYMLCYMSIYSITNNPEEMKEVLRKIKSVGLSKKEIDRIDRNRLIQFLRQRLHHFGTLCSRKARSITVGSDKVRFFAETSESSPVSEDLIMEDYKEYGYRRVTLKEYKAAVKVAKAADKEELVDALGFRMFRVEKLNEGITTEEYKVIFDSNKGFFYRDPETCLQMLEDEANLLRYKEVFNSMEPEKRRKVLKNFIRKNKGDVNLKTELRAARKMVLNKETMV